MKKMLMAAAAAVFAVAGSASAAVTSIEFVPVTITVPSLSGYVTTDLKATTTTDWTLAEVVLNLSSGGLFQHAFGGNGPPNEALVGAFPDLAFDTYVRTPQAGQVPPTAEGAVDIGGAPGSTFSATKLDVSWYNTNVGEVGTHTLGRFTISNDAQGSITAQVYSEGAAPLTVSYPIINGVVAVPEPASLGLLALGGLALAARRRQA